MRKFCHIKILILMLIIAAGFPFFSSSAQNLPLQNKQLRKVTFLPLWVPQPQFAGYYMAKEKGIYRKYGIDADIIPGGYNHNVVSSLKNGSVDFGILFLFTGMIERAKGTRLVNIGQVFQRSGIMFIAKKKSGIKSLKDFNGKTIGVWRTAASELTEGFLKKHNIKANVIKFDRGINIFLKDAVDITVMMSYNEYKRLINSGVNQDEVVRFNFSDYEMNFPEDGIYCMESTLKKDPSLCRKFVEASMEGWDYALSHKEETIQVMNKYERMAMVFSNRSHSWWMLNSMKDMLDCSGKSGRPGNLLQSDFDILSEFLYSNGFIMRKPLYDEFYKGGR